MEPLYQPLRGVELFAALPLVAPLVISQPNQSRRQQRARIGAEGVDDRPRNMEPVSNFFISSCQIFGEMAKGPLDWWGFWSDLWLSVAQSAFNSCLEMKPVMTKHKASESPCKPCYA